jgi:UDP-glucose 4-epimerase
MKILVTGCAGLLGSNYCRHLIDHGHEVLGVDDLSGGYKDYVPTAENFRFVELDLENTQGVSKVFSDHNPDVCFHFAAYAAEGLSPFVRNYNYRNNLVCSANVINECINHESKLVFTSSMAVYGDQSPPFTEELKPKPIDPYGIAKYGVEMDLELAHQQFGLEYNIVRPHNVVGKYQNIWDRYRNVIGIFIRRTLNDQPMIVYGDGEQTRAFSDIQYYMNPFDILLKNHNTETFNIGADKYYTLNQVAQTVQKIGNKHGHKVDIIHAEERHEAKHAYCDHTKAKDLLNFVDETNLEELIEDMFLWAKDQPNRTVKNMNYEVTKGIYDFWK